MKYVIAIAAAVMLYGMMPTVSSAQSGYNQRAYNNAAAAKASQQHYNNQTRRR